MADPARGSAGMMLRYGVASLRHRTAGFAGAFIALWCAAAIVAASGALLETGLRGAIVTQRLASTPVVVSGDQDVHRTTVEHDDDRTKVKHKSKPLSERVWLAPATARSVAAVRGVGEVVPEVSFPAYLVVDGRIVPAVNDSESYGHGWGSSALTPFSLLAGHAPQASGQIVIDRELAGRTGLHRGAHVLVQATAAPARYEISGIATASSGDLHDQSSIFFADREAARLSGRGGAVDLIGVTPRPGVSSAALANRLRDTVPGIVVHLGAGRGEVEFLDAADARVRLVSMAGALAATALLVAMLVVVSTLGLVISQRSRDLALLRAVAATPRQVRRLIGTEAALVGCAAGGLGAVTGMLLARALFDALIHLGAVPDTVRLERSFVVPIAAMAVTVLGAWAAARLAVRRTAYVRPAQALAEATLGRPGLGRGRSLAGLMLLAGGAALLVLLTRLHTEPAAMPLTFVTVIVLCTATAALGPALVRVGTTATRWGLSLAPVSGRLAHAHIRSNAARVSSALTPLVLLVAMAGTVLFVPTTLDGAARAQIQAGIHAGWIVTSRGPGVPGAARDALRQVAGVSAAVGDLHTTVRIGLTKYPALGIGTTGLRNVWDPGVERGSLAAFGAHSVAVSTVAADQLATRPGRRLTVTLGDGTRVALTVAAVYRRGLGFGDLTMAQDLISRHVDDPLADSVLVAGHASHAALAAALRPFPGLLVSAWATAGDTTDGAARSNTAMSYLLMGLVLAFCAIAIVNSLVMSVLDRGRDFGVLLTVGATRRQLSRALALEAFWTAGVGLVLGAAVCAGVLTAFSSGMTGTPSPSVDLRVCAAIAAVAVTLTVGATLVAGRKAVRYRHQYATG